LIHDAIACSISPIVLACQKTKQWENVDLRDFCAVKPVIMNVRKYFRGVPPVVCPGKNGAHDSAFHIIVH
jgi:hypothetical protein